MVPVAKNFSRRDAAHIALFVAHQQFLQDQDIAGVRRAITRAYPGISEDERADTLTAWTSTDRERLVELSGKRDSRVELGLVNNPSSPENALANIMENTLSGTIRAYAAEHGNAPHDKLVIAARRGSPLERAAAISNPRLALSDVGIDEDGGDRAAVETRIGNLLRAAQ